MHTKHYQPPSTVWRFVSTVFLTLAILLPGPVDADSESERQPLEEITIAYSSISGTMAPAWVTYEAGFFRKYGLDVHLVFIEGGSKAVKALLSGDAEVAQVGGAAVLRSNLNGSDTVMIAGFLNTMNYQFIVEKNITGPEQFPFSSRKGSRRLKKRRPSWLRNLRCQLPRTRYSRSQP